MFSVAMSPNIPIPGLKKAEYCSKIGKGFNFSYSKVLFNIFKSRGMFAPLIGMRIIPCIILNEAENIC
jgi:hypothetical protein